jgi:WD40 repeat protein
MSATTFKARPSSASASSRSTSSSSSSSSSTQNGIKPFPIRRDPCLSRSFRGHQGSVRCVSFCPILVRASDTGLPSYRYASDQFEDTADRLSTVSGRARAERLAHTNVQQLASGSEDHSVMIWHCKPHLRAFRFVGHTDTVNSVEWTKDASVVASASDDQTVRVWTPTA